MNHRELEKLAGELARREKKDPALRTAFEALKTLHGLAAQEDERRELEHERFLDALDSECLDPNA